MVIVRFDLLLGLIAFGARLSLPSTILPDKQTDAIIGTKFCLTNDFG